MTKFFLCFCKILKILVVSDYPKGGFDLQLIDKKLFSYFQNSGKILITLLPIGLVSNLKESTMIGQLEVW